MRFCWYRHRPEPRASTTTLRLYVGIGLSTGQQQAADYDSSAIELRYLTNADFTVLYGRVGYQPHPNIAIEGRVGLGLGGGSELATAVTLVREGLTYPINAETDLDSFLGFYGRFGGQVGATYLYGVVGLSKIYITREITGAIFARDFSWGFGIDIPLSDSITGTFERFSYYSGDGNHIDDLNFSVSWRF